MTIEIRRDRYGLTPVYYAVGHDLFEPPFVWGTTMRECHQAGAKWESIRLLPAGCDLFYDSGTADIEPWYVLRATPCNDTRDQAAAKLRNLLPQAALKLRTDQPAAITLSGGIDSAAVAVSLQQVGQDLTAYTAVYDPKSPDLKSARQVADHLEIPLVEVPIPHPTSADLEETIRVIELPQKAQVEIGWPCLVLARRMEEDGKEVCYGGEGSDELWASHAFAYHERKRPNAPGFHEYRRRDFAKQASRNFVREWKCFDQHRIDVRLPFLDQHVVEYILSLTEDVCRDSTWHAKRPLQQAFLGDLPEWVTTRQKLGFQDGLGIKQPIADGLQMTQRETGTWYHETYARLFPGARP